MATPIYFIALAKGLTAAGSQLPSQEFDKLWAQVQEVDRSVGAKVLLACESRWWNEEYHGFIVIEYPSMEAYMEKVKRLDKLDWFRYVSTTTILGTKPE